MKNETLKTLQTSQQEELSWGSEGTQEKLPTRPNARRRPSLAQRLREEMLVCTDPAEAQMLKRAYDKEIYRLIEKSK